MSRRVITAIVLIVIIINLGGLKYFNSELVRRGTSCDQDKQNLLYNMNYGEALMYRLDHYGEYLRGLETKWEGFKMLSIVTEAQPRES